MPTTLLGVHFCMLRYYCTSVISSVWVQQYYIIALLYAEVQPQLRPTLRNVAVAYVSRTQKDGWARVRERESYIICVDIEAPFNLHCLEKGIAGEFFLCAFTEFAKHEYPKHG